MLPLSSMNLAKLYLTGFKPLPSEPSTWRVERDLRRARGYLEGVLRVGVEAAGSVIVQDAEAMLKVVAEEEAAAAAADASTTESKESAAQGSSCILM
jgi:hypothetical protein